MRVTHYNEVKKLQKRVKKAEKEKDENVEKEVKKSEALTGSPPQYSERMSDISSIRTATTMRSDRETLKVSKNLSSKKSALV